MIPMGRQVLLLVMVVLSGALPAQPTPQTQLAKETMTIRTREGRQMDVWLDGRRMGLTPLKLELRPGTYFLTAGADGLEPILRRMEVQAGGEQLTVLADRALAAERLPMVVEEIMAAFRAQPANAHVRILAALLTTDRRDHSQLLDSLPPGLGSDPTVLLSRARWAMTDGQPGAALALVEEALHREARMASLWRMKAWALIELGRNAEAKDASELAVRIDPLHADSFVVRGDVHRAAGELEFARLNYERALDLQPDNQRALRGLGRAEETP